MPLDPNASVGDRVKEFETGPTFQKTKAKYGKDRAVRQAIAVALNTGKKAGRRKKK